ncbi:MAG: pantoate--beta-alanine ligase [Maricaulaceae bacterium]
MSKPLIIRSLRELRAQMWEWRGFGETIGYVPTMGALHDGHLSLIRLSKQKASKTIASIYVNPTQFAPDEDFGSYPRTNESDIEKLTNVGCDAVYIPNSTIYAEDHSTYLKVNGVGDGLETDHRPSFFEGVVLVVMKLLNRVQPDVAIFGEKDYQQLTIIRRMVRDMDMPVKIIGGPIMRDAHGLALSSRNSYFDADGLKVARQLNRLMLACADKLASGANVETTLSETKAVIIAAGFDTVDYLNLAHADSLALITAKPFATPARLLVVARCKGIRLLDNCPVG